MTDTPTPDTPRHLFPRRHQHLHPDGTSDRDTLEECLLIDTTFAAWLLARKLTPDEPSLDMRTVRAAWRAAWVEGVIRERLYNDYHERISSLLGQIDGPVN